MKNIRADKVREFQKHSTPSSADMRGRGYRARSLKNSINVQWCWYQKTEWTARDFTLYHYVHLTMFEHASAVGIRPLSSWFRVLQKKKEWKRNQKSRTRKQPTARYRNSESTGRKLVWNTGCEWSVTILKYCSHVTLWIENDPKPRQDIAPILHIITEPW